MWPLPLAGLKSVLPPEMDSPARLVRDVVAGLPPPLERPPNAMSATTPLVPLPTLPESPLSSGVDRRPSAANLRSMFRPGVQATIRTVTPEPLDTRTTAAPQDPYDASSSSSSALSNAHVARVFGSMSPQSSPRSIPGAGVLSNNSATSSSSSRRQGRVFSDTLASSFDSASSSPPPSRPTPYRPRTHTMDGSAFRQQMGPSAAAAAAAGSGGGLEPRHRVGSFSSSGSLPVNDDLRGPPLPPLDTHAYTSMPRPLELQIPAASRERKSSSRRLIKRASSRPTSPLVSPPPSVDSLPLPIPTEDANKVLLLMKTLCGRMRGEIEYQSEPGGPWAAGMCYIEEEKGSLMFDSGDSGAFHLAVVPDLRGCRVLPVERPGRTGQCLELVSAQSGLEAAIWPLAADEFDLWLAALLCWQQLRPGVVKAGPGGRAGSTPTTERQEVIKRWSSAARMKDATIIKVGKVMLWDKGVATSPRAIVKRPSTRDLRSSQTSWRRVSCILQGNGEFKLMTENDVTILSVIELAQLARCAVQQLDKSVLDEEYSIAIFPIYSSTSTQLSIFRPVYIALDSRVAFEVWFVLLRAFAIPDMYGVDPAADNQLYEITDFDAEHPGELFRVEKTLSLRVTEAKIKARTVEPGGYQPPHERLGKTEHDPLVGNYFAEVIMDGEVRARTTTKTDTKNPFWREECEFTDLPSTLPFLSIVLKRVDGNLESFSHQLQASLGLPKTGNLTEVMCGSVDIPLSQIELGKDHEEWLPIMDDRQLTVGTMMAKVRHEELVVLMSSEYKGLSELLHRFSSGLTAQIAEVLPTSLRRVADIFLNIFQVSGSASEWLMALVEDEIDGIGNQTTMKKMRFSRRLKSTESVESASDREQIVRDMGRSLAGEANLLFRGNSLLTQALEFHMRRLGKEYLEEVLSDKIFEINEINPDCEVDPSKVQPWDDVQRHWDQLMHLTAEVWECITASAGRFPPELRHILKYIRAVAEDRYGDFLRTVAYTSVSGFLFLRFICPAILNPKLFGLLRDHPRPRAQRTFTLIAKGLQTLANLSTIGKKETWMDPMNRFLTLNRQSVKDFIDAVCAIPAERSASGVGGGSSTSSSSLTVPASYSTPITILGRLSPTAREGFPSLPYLVDHSRSFASLVRLWTDANHRTASESHGFDGDLQVFADMCADLQRRADECLARVEAVRLAETASSQPATDITSAIDAADHASLVDTINLSYGGSAVWMDVEGAPPGSSGSEVSRDYHNHHHQQQQQHQHQHSWGGGPRDSSVGSEPSGGGTLRGLRNVKPARKFLSGFINRKGRTASPGASTAATVIMNSGSGTPRERDRDVSGKRDKTGRGRGSEQWGNSVTITGSQH